MARTVEGLILALAGLGWLMLVQWGQAYVTVGQPDTGYFHSVGYLMTSSSRLLFTLAAEITFGVTAIILNIIFMKTKLVPKWISIWGLIGGASILALGVMKILGLSVSSVEAAFTAPIALNEMVLAVWLIVKRLETGG